LSFALLAANLLLLYRWCARLAGSREAAIALPAFAASRHSTTSRPRWPPAPLRRAAAKWFAPCVEQAAVLRVEACSPVEGALILLERRAA